ncbi:hypothetical protein QL285_083834 [Trifolium repens]|nr:hypothetical protein QL285_083834 [Trifolium repens]
MATSNRSKNNARTKIIRNSNHEENFRQENFVHENYLNFYIRNCKEKKVIPQNAVDVENLEGLHLSEVAEIIKRENLSTFCNLKRAYIEDLVRIFYSGLQEREGAEFEFCIGKKIFKFSNNLWLKLFELETGKNLQRFTDVDGPKYNMNEFASTLTRNGKSPNGKAGRLNKGPRVLLWIVNHILRPRGGSYSRFDWKDIDLMYLMMERKKMDWPHYIVSRLFALRDSKKDHCFGYSSWIITILDHFKITYKVAGAWIIPKRDQIFSITQMKKMDYKWNDEKEDYEFCGKDDEEEEPSLGNEERGKRQRVENHESENMESDGSEISNGAIMEMLKEMNLRQMNFQNEVTIILNDMHAYNVSRFDHLQNQLYECIKQQAPIDQYFNSPPSNPDGMNDENNT